MTSSRDSLPLAQAWRSVTSASALLVAAGVVASITASDAWAWLVVVGLATGAIGQVTIGVIAFRRTMSRPWPDVAPLTDDDWD